MLKLKYNKNLAVDGTSLQAEIKANYSDLVSLFGKPRLYKQRDNILGVDTVAINKIDAEWKIETSYGVITIYNYKDGKNYLGKEGIATTKLTDWHIGGHNKSSATFISGYIYGALNK